jgi:hypothetical protein
MTVFTVGINNIENNNRYAVYPNPSKGSFTVKGIMNTDKPVDIEITNALGQVIYHDVAITNNRELNKQITLNNISNGVYYLHLRTENESKALKITVQQ